MAEKLSIQVPIKSSVLEQLNYRRDLLSRSGDGTLDVNELMQLNNKGAWVVLASSANLPNDNEKNVNKLARENILTGGTVGFKIDEESGKYKLNIRKGFTPGDPSTSTYDQNSTLGFRPMPGITDLTVASKTTYGALRQVEIGVKAWNQEQLTMLEKLYFRPGFTMFVEFGHASYINAEGKITAKNESLYLNFIKGKKLSLIKKEIKKRRVRSGYNYDALIGKVQNFSWSLAKDGSYDCSVKLISQGELAESISAIGYDKKGETPDNIRNSSKDTPNDLLLNMLLTLNKVTGPGTTKNFEKAFNLDAGDGTVFYSDPPAKKSKEEIDEQMPEVDGMNAADQQKLAQALGVTREELEGALEAQLQGGPQRFIPLYSLFKIFNSKFVKPLLKKKDADSDDAVLFSVDPTISTYNYFETLISNDPFVCAVPSPTNSTTKYQATDLYGGSFPRENDVSRKYFEKLFKDDFSLNSPYFLLVNVECLIGIQKTFLNRKKENSNLNFSIFSFAKKVLELVSSALGGVCTLDLHKDEDSDKWVILDRDCNDSIETKKSVPIIDLVGLQSLVNNVKLESKISSNLASAMAIAAASSNNSGASEGMFKFNAGVTDRYIEDSDDDETTEQLKEEKAAEEAAALEKNVEAIQQAYKSYAKDNNHNRSLFEGISADHRNFTKQERTQSKSTKASAGKEVSFDGLIPFDLSFELDGIVGLRPTDCFAIGKNIMPDRYNGKVGFIITNIDHSIGSDNRWITEITSKMFMLPDKLPEGYFTQNIRESKEKLAEKTQSNVQPNIKAKYGEPGDESILKRVKVPEGFNLTYGGRSVKTIRIHKDVSSNLENAMKEVLQVYNSEKLKDLRINIYQGSYNDRTKRNGVTKSTHAWGIALDFDADNNKLRWKRDQASFARPEYKQFLGIFKKYGFYNLGTEKNYDFMHFQAWDPNQPE